MLSQSTCGGVSIGDAKEKLFKDYEQHLMALDAYTIALRTKSLRALVAEEAFVGKVYCHVEKVCF